MDNSTAAAVDEKYLAASDAPMGVYRLGYYPHNVHFVMASALMAGDGANGRAKLTRRPPPMATPVLRKVRRLRLGACK